MMRKFIVNSLFFICCFNSIGCLAQSGGRDLKLVFIRHGEKSDDGEHLTCAGFNRSVLLPAVLYRKFHIADNVYVPSLKLGRVTKSSRMLETILPYAIKYNLPINSKYDENDSKGLATGLLGEKGIIIIVWDHANIANIVAALGVRKLTKWYSDDFDSIWIVTVHKGKPKLQIDHEGLVPPKDCPF